MHRRCALRGGPPRKPNPLMQPQTLRASRPRFALTPVALVAFALLQAGAVRAQAPAESAEGPKLKPSPQLSETIPAEARPHLPMFVEGDRVTGRTDLDTVIEGNAELRRGDT